MERIRRKQVSDLLIRPSKGRLIAILVSTLGITLLILFVVVENFSVKFGEGGFGTVFHGSLPSSTKIAVKRPDDNVQVNKSFLAGVETLGSVHHINLVTLIGFCVEKSHRLLVYEYLQNGSLDRWIFSRNPECTLSWKLRQKIIHDVAKGLAYLHDGCHQKILHLDVKPQNILLDENYNARLADFGLSKMIDRNQNQVLTTMRGTPEILCGRRNVDRSQPEEEMHLLRLFTKKAGKGKLLELVDKFNEDMQLNGAEAMKMIMMAAWCLQADYSRRPSTRAVVIVLAGDLNVKDNLSYVFLNKQAGRATATPSSRAGTTNCTISPLPSILSGPR
ncbi:hypothetical protein PTKIN_Ptkin07bG0022500 [Pterospermum kingtungense]